MRGMAASLHPEGSVSGHHVPSTKGSAGGVLCTRTPYAVILIILITAYTVLRTRGITPPRVFHVWLLLLPYDPCHWDFVTELAYAESSAFLGIRFCVAPR